jgi:hypothetical protein
MVVAVWSTQISSEIYNFQCYCYGILFKCIFTRYTDNISTISTISTFATLSVDLWLYRWKYNIYC